MPQKPFRACAHFGCTNLTRERFCEDHIDDKKKEKQFYEKRRGTAYQRGYDHKWNKESKRFRNKPDNQFCYIQGPQCAELVECVDHIFPPDGPDDPRFNEDKNYGPACIACNSWKNHRSIQQLVKDEANYYEGIDYNPIEYLKEGGLYYG